MKNENRWHFRNLKYLSETYCGLSINTIDKATKLMNSKNKVCISCKNRSEGIYNPLLFIKYRVVFSILTSLSYFLVFKPVAMYKLVVWFIIPFSISTIMANEKSSKLSKAFWLSVIIIGGFILDLVEGGI